MIQSQTTHPRRASLGLAQLTATIALATGAAGSAGCEGLTSSPQPIVSVLKATPDDCFSLMTIETPIAKELGIAGLCTYVSAPRLLAGIDLVEMIIDYGPDVDFSGTTAAPTPQLTLTVDGTALELPITLSGERRVGNRAFFVATFRAPANPTTNMQLTVGVNAGFQTTVADVFAVVAPPVTLAMLDCPPNLPCQFPGATGSAHVRISVPGTVPQTIAVHTTINGFAQPDSIPPVITRVVNGHTEADTAIEVPAAPEGAVWTIAAQLGTQTPALASATIALPPISTQLSCGDACNVATGTAVGLEITAPAEIRPLLALIDTRIDGVPQLVAAPVTLVQNADGTSTGLVTLTAPSTAGTWEIDASIAGYSASALLATVH